MSSSSELSTDSVGSATSSDSHILHIDLTGEVGKMANDLMKHLDKAMRGLIYKILVFHNSENQMLEVWKNVEHRIAAKPSRRELNVVRFQEDSAVIECALGHRHRVRISRLGGAYDAARLELRSRIGDVPCSPALTNETVTAANGEALQPDMAVNFWFEQPNRYVTTFCIEYAETEEYAHVLAKCMLLRHADPDIASFLIVKASNLPGNPKLAAIDPDYSEDYQIWAPLDPGDTVPAGNHTTLEFNFDEDISIPPSGVERQRQNYELVHLSDRRRTYAYCAEPNIPVFQVRGEDNVLVAPFAYCKTWTEPELVRETIYMDIEILVVAMHQNREGTARAHWEQMLERRSKGRGGKRGGKRGGSRVEKLPSRVPVRYIDPSKPRADPNYRRIELSDEIQVVDEIFLLLGSARSEQWVVPSDP